MDENSIFLHTSRMSRFAAGVFTSFATICSTSCNRSFHRMKNRASSGASAWMVPRTVISFAGPGELYRY